MRLLLQCQDEFSRGGICLPKHISRAEITETEHKQSNKLSFDYLDFGKWRKIVQAHRTSAEKSPSSRGAFILRELLVLLAVIALAGSIRISALSSVASHSKIALCKSNLKQYDMALQLCGDDSLTGTLPTEGGGNWPWDLGGSTINSLLQYGMKRPNFYCPGFPQLNNDRVWNAGNTGYAQTLAGTFDIPPDDRNTSFNLQRITLDGSDPTLGQAGTVYNINPATRVLLADATLSLDTQTNLAQASNYNWVNLDWAGMQIGTVYQYGIWSGGATAHMAGIVPAGGNTAMLDGHVEWRAFTNMMSRTRPHTVNFWW